MTKFPSKLVEFPGGFLVTLFEFIFVRELFLNLMVLTWVLLSSLNLEDWIEFMIFDSSKEGTSSLSSNLSSMSIFSLNLLSVQEYCCITLRQELRYFLCFSKFDWSFQQTDKLKFANTSYCTFWLNFKSESTSFFFNKPSNSSLDSYRATWAASIAFSFKFLALYKEHKFK